MTDVDRMSPDQIRAWAEQQRRQAAAEHRPPRPRELLSRVKMHDYGNQRPRTWEFQLRPGARAVLNRNGTMSEASVLGLRRVDNAGALALLVREGERLLALRRAYGQTWGHDPGASYVEVDVVSPPVEGWAITEDYNVVPAPAGATEELRVRTNNPIGPF